MLLVTIRGQTEPNCHSTICSHLQSDTFPLCQLTKSATLRPKQSSTKQKVSCYLSPFLNEPSLSKLAQLFDMQTEHNSPRHWCELMRDDFQLHRRLFFKIYESILSCTTDSDSHQEFSSRQHADSNRNPNSIKLTVSDSDQD